MEGEAERVPRGGRQPAEYGVAVGPVFSEDDVHQIMQMAAGSVDGMDVVTPDCEFFENSICALIRLDYDAAKSLANWTFERPVFNDRQIKLSLVECGRFPQNAERIMCLLPESVSGNTANFANGPRKFQMSLNFPVNMSMLLLFGALYADLHGLQIENLNFTGCKIRGKLANGLRYLKVYYPHLKTINLSENEVPSEELEYAQLTVLTGIEVITDAPDYGQDQVGDGFEALVNESDGEIEDDRVEFVIPGLQPPQLVMPDHDPAPYGRIEWFPSMEIKDCDFPTNVFLRHFFEACWDQEMDCERFYHNDCIFSLTEVHEDVPGPASNYRNMTTDGTRGIDARAYGRAQVMERLKILFPYGFKANITGMHGSILSKSLYCVIVHGVFENPLGGVLGFHRSFAIAEQISVFSITNDNIMVHNVLLP